MWFTDSDNSDKFVDITSNLINSYTTTPTHRNH